MVVGGGVGHVYLQNCPDPSRFGQEKGGQFEFGMWRRYVGAAVLVQVSLVFGCQVLPAHLLNSMIVMVLKSS